MSFIDNTFKSLPKQLLDQFGIDVTYIKAATSQTYNATTGEVGGSDTNVEMKAIITSVTATEFQSTSQTTDVQVIFGNEELGNYFPTSRDRIQYTEAGATKVARIVDVKTQRGDEPILHTVLARPQ
tara:strand:+ start:445 stop:822 length:378 start_codon:yes stop_codon:yes gene_type:complete